MSGAFGRQGPAQMHEHPEWLHLVPLLHYGTVLSSFSIFTSVKGLIALSMLSLLMRRRMRVETIDDDELTVRPTAMPYAVTARFRCVAAAAAGPKHLPLLFASSTKPSKQDCSWSGIGQMRG